MADKLDADLVLQGGGVKGIALAGAVGVLMDAYHFRRVAGTSAGSIVAALVAAGYTGDEVRQLMNELPYAKVPDSGPMPLINPALSLLRANGLFKGDVILDWIRDRLAEKNVHTFANLALPSDPGADPYLSGDRAYRLVVTATDTTCGRALRLPWDYRSAFGLDPNTQPVAEAVRMSLSIPLFFVPQKLVDQRTNLVSTIVDGGVLSNFPVEIFDRQDGRAPRWPTFGVGVIPDLPGGDSTLMPHLPTRLPGPLGLLSSAVTTAICGHDQTYLDQPRNAERLIRIDTNGVGIVSFGIKKPARDQMFNNGDQVARTFLASWDWQAYVKRYFPDGDNPTCAETSRPSSVKPRPRRT